MVQNIHPWLKAPRQSTVIGHISKGMWVPQGIAGWELFVKKLCGWIPHMLVEKNINEYISRYAKYALRNSEFYKKEEGYKYRAVATFRKFFDLKSKNFPVTLERSLADASNLIASRQYYPKEMLLRIARRNSNFLRKELIVLLDGSGSVYNRIDEFINNLNRHHKQHKYFKEYGKQTYFDYRFVSFLLAAYKPEKYIYVKYSEFKKLGDMIGYPISVSGSNGQRYEVLFSLAKTVQGVLKQNSEFRKVHKKITEPFEYKDPSLSWGTTDFVFNVARRLGSAFDKEAKKAIKRNLRIQSNKIEELEDMLVDDEIIESEQKRNLSELAELAKNFRPAGEAYVEKEGKYKIRRDNAAQKERIKILENYGCQVCGFTLEYVTDGGKKRKYAHADHIIDKEDGGTEEASNLWVLCPNCHAKKTLGIITVNPGMGKIWENGKEIKLHHNRHLRWYKQRVLKID